MEYCGRDCYVDIWLLSGCLDMNGKDQATEATPKEKLRHDA